MRTTRSLTALSLATTVALAVASLDTSGAAASRRPPTHRSAKIQQVTISGTNGLRFSPSSVHLHTGEVRITLKDLGAYPHNVVIPSLKFTSKSVTGDPGGNATSFTVDFRSKGRFGFFCQYHQSAGMTGTFVIS